MMECPHCGYVNTNGPPVRLVCICCVEPLIPKGELPYLGRTALDKRAKFTRYCYDPLAQERIAERCREKKAAESESSG